MSAGIPLMVEAQQVDSLETILAPIHDQWIAQVGQMLAPALAPRATFWERWGVVRYLTDRFDNRFRLECALIDGLNGLLSPEAAGRLNSTRVALESIRARIACLGRRRGTGGVVAGFAGRLIEQLKLWCAQVEFATRPLSHEDLDQESHRLLERLKAAAGLGL